MPIKINCLEQAPTPEEADEIIKELDDRMNDCELIVTNLELRMRLLEQRIFGLSGNPDTSESQPQEKLQQSYPVGC